MAFGSPVVPELNSTYSGWSAATAVNVGVAGRGRRAARPTSCPAAAVVAVEVRDVHDVAQRRQGGDDLVDLLGPVDVLGAVAVAVDGDEHDRLDLGEAVDHRAHAELRRAARPHRADRRRGEEGDQRLGDVRGVGDDTVAAPTPSRRSPAAAAATSARARPTSARSARGSGCGRRRRRRRGAPAAGGEGVFGVVERGAGEPRTPGIVPPASMAVGGVVPAHAGERGRRPPEAVELGDGPGVQRRVVGEPELRWRTGPAAVAVQTSAGGVQSTSPRRVDHGPSARRGDWGGDGQRDRRGGDRWRAARRARHPWRFHCRRALDEVFGGQIAARRRRERRPAETAERGVEPCDAPPDRRPGVEQGRARVSWRCNPTFVPIASSTSFTRRGVATPVVSARVR